MDKFYKVNKLTAQGVSEPPGPVGDSSSVSGSTRWSPSDWTNGEGKVDPRASPRSVITTGDQKTSTVVKKENGCKKITRRYLEFDEDIVEIIEEVEMPTQASKEKTPPSEKATRIVKEKFLKGDKIIRYMRKSPEEESACRRTRSLARSQSNATRDEAASTSELDTPAEMSDSGSEAAVTRECLRRKVMMNRATTENKSNDEDSIVIKMSEWKAMTEIIREVFREIQGIGNRLYLMSKKDADIKKRSDAISNKANKLHSMLDEIRLKKNARMVRATRLTFPPGRSKEKKGKRKEISPIEGKGDNKRKRLMIAEASYAETCAGNSSAKATSDCTDRWKGRLNLCPRKKRKKNGHPDNGQEGERRKGGSGQAKEAGGTEEGTKQARSHSCQSRAR